MNTVALIEKNLLSANFLTVCSVIEALEGKRSFDSLTAYSQLDLKYKANLDRLSSGDFIDDLSYSLLQKLSFTEELELLMRLKNLEKSSFS